MKIKVKYKCGICNKVFTDESGCPEQHEFTYVSAVFECGVCKRTYTANERELALSCCTDKIKDK